MAKTLLQKLPPPPNKYGIDLDKKYGVDMDKNFLQKFKHNH